MSFINALIRKIKTVLGTDADTKRAETMYWDIVGISRQEMLFTDFKIPDTTNGRFDSLMLHLYPVLNNLNQQGRPDLSTKILNIMIYDMDRSLRESGVGDPAITRKMRNIGEAYMGRIDAYKKAFDALPQTDMLDDVLFRNVYRSDTALQGNVADLRAYITQYYKESLDKSI
jgi:cytochrome b pre-mRNA-processing protein 3